MKFPCRILMGCVLPVMLASCVGKQVEARLAESSVSREKEFLSLADRVGSEPQTGISWESALQRMRRDNLGLQQSRKMRVDAEKLTQRQWLTLVPRTGAYMNISKDIASLTDFTDDDLYASLVASFNIPNPIEFYAMLYGAALQVQNARWSSQLDERRAFVELYAAYLEAGDLRDEEAALTHRQQTLWAGGVKDIAKSLNNLSKEADNLKRRRVMHRGNVNRLLNTPGGNWDLTGNLPSFSYRERFRTMKIGRDFGKLALNLYAIQIESAILQKQRVKFRQWPAINFGLSSPPIYTSSGDNGISGEDFVMFSGASKTFDATDVLGRESIGDAEFRLKITREQLRLTMEREAARLSQIRDAYSRLLKEERVLESSLKRFDRPATAEADAVLRDLELRSRIELQLIQTRRQIEQLDLQYLIWDERFWKS